MASDIKPIVRVEDLEKKLWWMADVLATAGKGAGAVGRARVLERGEAFRTAPTEQLVDDFIGAALRALEDDIAIAEEVAGEAEVGGDFIQPSERELEIVKRALVRLKLPQLKRLADKISVESRGNQAEVVDRIARHYEDDPPSEVARVILSYEEAEPERGIVDRIYRVREPMSDLEASAITFDRLSGRYIRVGIARWLVFSAARLDQSGLWLEGLYRAYRADATREGEEFELVAVSSDAHVTARIRPEQEFVEVRARGEAESRAMIRALEWGTRLRHSGEFPLKVEVPGGRLMGWDPRSIFMLDFLDRRLPDHGIDIINLTTARFETAATERGFTRRPSVRAVALHGQHLLSSRAACELLVEGRGLVELSFEVRFRPSPDAEFVFPLRISVQSDHVAVLTGYGAHSPETAAELHREVVRRVRAALFAGVHAGDRLEALARRITARAASEAPVLEADIFAPPDDWARDDDELDRVEVEQQAAETESEW